MRERQFNERPENSLPQLKKKSARGALFTLMGTGSAFLLNLVSTAILARLLIPEDFGLIAMVTAITGLLLVFGDIGLAMATIQRESISHDQVSSLFWVNVGLGLALTLLVAACSPLFAWIYQESRLFEITLALSTTFLLTSLGIQHQALLKRQMRFGLLQTIQICSQIIGISLAIFFAAYGGDYWALVSKVLASAAILVVLSWLTASWIPSLPKRKTPIRELLAFGGFFTASRVMNYASRNLDNILIGLAWGPQALGFYTKAYQLLLLPIRQVNNPITQVAIPALSRLQSQPDAFRQYYLRGVELLAFASVPLITLAWVAAEPIILILLGPNWLAVIPIFKALIPAALLGAFNVIRGWVFIPLGRTRQQFYCVIGGSILIVASFLLTYQLGPVAVAWGLSLAYMIKEIPQTWYAYRRSPLTLHDLIQQIWRPIVASCLAAALLYLFNSNVGLNWPHSLDFLLMCVVFASLYGCSILLLPGGRYQWIRLLRLSRSLRTTFLP